MEIVDPRVPLELLPDGSRATVIAEHQDEYRDLPSIRTSTGRVITRWSPSLAERAAIVRGEDVYVTILSGWDKAGKPLSINPLYVTIGPVDWRREDA